MLRALAKLPEFTVILVVHGPDGVEELRDFGSGMASKSSPSDFIERVERWAHRASSMNREFALARR